MKPIADHAQIPYYRCKKCRQTAAAAENGEVLIIPPNAFVRSGSKTSKAPVFYRCSNCGCEISVPAHHQTVPCIGDIVRFPLDPKLPGGKTHTGKVTNILYDNNNMPSLKVTIEVNIRIDNILANHQTVPRIGDIVRSLVGTERSRDMTPPVRILSILSDNETGLLHGFMAECEDDVELMGVRLEYCHKWDEADDGTAKIE